MLKRFTHFLLLLALAAPLSAAVSPSVRVNSVGLVPGYAKRATVLTATGGSIAFSVKRVADNSVAFSGNLAVVATNAETSESYRTAVFDSLTETGQFYVDVAAIGQSVNFYIGPDAYNQSYWLNVMGFYNQRCGMATSMTYKGNTWGHAACHVTDGDLVHYNGSASTQDASGGWHDAGDFNKYVINAAAAVGPALHAFERFSALQAVTLPTGVDPALPDVLEEWKWELDWMRKMQFPDGKVSDKITVWGGFEPYPLMPNLAVGQRYFEVYGTAEIGMFTAIMALASRVYQPYDAAYAATLLSAATLSYNYLQANPTNVSAVLSSGTGDYTQNDAVARLWAAVEMWETTGGAACLTDAEARITAQGPTYVDTRWDWANARDLPLAVYALSARAGKNAALNSAVRGKFVAAANTLVTNRNGHGYGRACGTYGWGYNGSMAGNCYVLDVADRISPNSAYRDTAQDQLSWLYGRNYYNRSQVTGEGINPPMLPHDRESEADGVVPPKPGHVVGGGHAATDWNDNPPSSTNYAVNEIAINWDGAMDYALAMFYYGTPPTPTATPTASPYAGTPTSTYTASPTPSATPSFSASPTFSVSPTISPTPSATPSATPSYSASPTPVPFCPAEMQAGKTTAGLSTFALGSTYLDGSSVTVTGPGTLGALSVHLATAGPFRLGFYTDAAGKPGTLLVETASVAGVVGWNQVAVAGPSIAAGTYWVMLQGSTGMSATYDAGASGQEYYASASYGPFPPVFPAGTSSNWRWAAYASVCPVVSPTPTATRTGSFTASPTITPSATATASATGTPSATSSPSPSGTASATPSESPSPTESATATASPTVSPTFTDVPPGSSATATPSFSASPTDPPSGTPTATPSASPIASATWTATATPTATVTLSFSPSPPATSTATPSPTDGPATSTASATPTPSFSPGPSLTATPTAIAAPAGTQDLKVLQVVPVPQPVRGTVALLQVQLQGSAEGLELQLYTHGFTKVAKLSCPGSFGPGWNRAAFALPELANGTYFMLLRAFHGGHPSPPGKPGRLVLLR